MGKRSSFERNPRDFYPTPYEAVAPVIPHLDTLRYIEPCAGNGALIGHLNDFHVKCEGASDIEPQEAHIKKMDVFDYKESRYPFITNPPWDRKTLHPIIDHLRQLAPTWLLIDANWMFTKQSGPYMKYCSKVIAVGRVKWIPDSKMTGKDDCAWFLFQKGECKTIFYGR